MTPHRRATRETMENIDPNDTGTSTDIVKAINKTAHNRLFASRDTNHEARADSRKARAVLLSARAHQVFFTFRIDVHIRAINI